MKIEVNEHGTIVLKEVFNPIKLVKCVLTVYNNRQVGIKCIDLSLDDKTLLGANNFNVAQAPTCGYCLL